ncbi:MAG: isoaspartyl peptidase/L-asparaginase [Firmicutes bacterium]|nr:isoaspartyl peptidase/L-asparaginase [Bacillota bacterium]
MSFVGIVTHGGAGSPKEWQDGCINSADIGMQRLLENRSAYDAVLESVALLENDGRFNAGCGSSYRLDGKTIEMDAAIMSSDGRLGAVACITGVKNPVLVASEVAHSPHHILTGQGAVLFARKRGFGEYYPDIQWAKERHAKLMETFSKKKGDLTREWGVHDFEENWNFETASSEIFPMDTVGAVAKDKKGVFAAAVSTGGSGAMLKGRVGDTPLIGSGFFAGPYGAVACTGIGEEIMKKLLAKIVYDWLAQGTAPEVACEKGVHLFSKTVPVGVIAVSSEGAGFFSNTGMAAAVLERRD